jgi:RNA-binding protein YlmH
MRYDVVIAKMVHLSRSSCVSLFREKKIFVNGRQMENNSGVMKEGDVVSVRGYGKFVCDSILGETRKGNLSVQLSRYV